MRDRKQQDNNNSHCHSYAMLYLSQLIWLKQRYITVFNLCLESSCGSNCHCALATLTGGWANHHLVGSVQHRRHPICSLLIIPLLAVCVCVCPVSLPCWPVLSRLFQSTNQTTPSNNQLVRLT